MTIDESRFERLLDAVARHTGVPRAQFTAKSKNHSLGVARAVCLLLAKKHEIPWNVIIPRFQCERRSLSYYYTTGDDLLQTSSFRRSALAIEAELGWEGLVAELVRQRGYETPALMEASA